MSRPKDQSMSRRERQIMDVIHRRGQATAAEVLQEIADPPSYSAVRALLRVLEEKGHVGHVQQGPRYVYLSKVPRDTARRTALKQLVKTYFDGSTEQAMAVLLDMEASRLTDAELDRLAQLVEKARKKDC